MLANFSFQTDLHPRATTETDQENQATETKFDTHCHPHTAESPHWSQTPSESQAHAPHRDKIHQTRLKSITCTNEHTISHDTSCEHRFSPCLDTQSHSTQLHDLLDRSKDRHHQRGTIIHHDTHNRHDKHTQSDRYETETASEVEAASADTLSDERSSSVTDTITRHITKALRSNSETISSYRHHPQRRYYDGRQDLCATHNKMFQSHWGADFESITKSSASREIRAPSSTSQHILISASAKYTQLLRASQEIKRKESSRNDLSESRCESSSLDTHIRAPNRKIEPTNRKVVSRKNQEPIEKHIHSTHNDASHARDLHITATTQHTARKLIHLGSRESSSIYKEIGRSIATYFRCSSDPDREIRADSHTQSRKDTYKQKARDKSLSHNQSCFLKFPSANFLGDLYSKSSRDREAQTANEPSSASHEAHGCARISSEATEHRSIDILHKDCRQLREDSWQRKLEGQHDLLPCSQLLPIAYASQEPLCIR